MFLPEDYSPAISYIIIFVLAFPAFIIQSILRTAVDSGLRHKEVIFFTFFACFFRIGAMLILGYFFKIIGIVLALALATWLEFILYYLATINKEFFTKMLNEHTFISRIINKF